jgi:predicted nucleic acid-binding protein
MAPPVERIVDAGPLVAWLSERDHWHDWTTGTITAGTGELHTTEIVLGEACHLLGGTSSRVHRLLSYVHHGVLVLHPLWPAHLARCQELMLKYDFMDPADASLVVLSELHPDAALLTVDAHFRLYRRFRRQTLPVVMPLDR